MHERDGTDATREPESAGQGGGGGAEQRTALARKWTIKMLLIALAMFGLGMWGLLDAVWVYPARGARAAEFLEFRYLEESSKAGTTANDRVSIADPVAAFARLDQRKRANESMTEGETFQRDWLLQLRLIGKLRPENTTYPREDFRTKGGARVKVASAFDRLAELRKKYVTGEGSAPAKPASPLERYDLPFQWAVMVFGLVVCAWLVLNVLRASRLVYRWLPDHLRLTLPGGERIVPADVAEFDKTEWHKVFITLRIRPEHPQLGGKALRLDLLRYEPLENWVLAMEDSVKPAEPESAGDAGQVAPAGAPGAPTPDGANA
jgi:hypothetical protein